MPTSEQLKAAVEAGIIEPGQAEKLEAFISGAPQPPRTRTRTDPDVWDAPRTPADREDVHFVRGFHDIFIALGIALLFGGLAVAALASGSALMVFAGATALAWALAEYLAAKKRLVLPSIALAIAFVMHLMFLVATLFGADIATSMFDTPSLPLIVVFAVTLIGALAFFVRFRLPFALGLAAAGAIALMFTAVSLLTPFSLASHRIALFLVAGIATFAAAMAFDLSDPERRTLRADNAFWLHLLAAPLLVHAILSFVLGDGEALAPLAGALIILAVLAGIAVVALLVDRRAMLVAGLGYLAAAISTIIRETDMETSLSVAVTLVLVGGGVVALGSGWQSVRRGVFAILPFPGLARRLPPVEVRP